MASVNAMQALPARLLTFETAQPPSKRRASTQNGRKKAKNATAWPHKQPLPEHLAKAGFYYNPTAESLDNVQCFFCNVGLDGWEPEDDALREHYTHAQKCAFVFSLMAGEEAKAHLENGTLEDAEDPMSEACVNARRATFLAFAQWPHEGKKGWKCKVNKMVESGFCYNPISVDADADDADRDGVSCTYCGCELDGWEPKDDPMAEHRKRGKNCAFILLLDKLHGSRGKKATKGKTGQTARGSTASRASILSSLSALSETPGLMDDSLELNETTNLDDSLTSTTSTASRANGRKQRAPPKAKTSKTTTKAQERVSIAVPPQDEVASLPDRVSIVDVEADEPAPAPASKKPAAKKATAKGRKVQAVENQPDDAISIDEDAKFEKEEKTGTSAKHSKRGVKRTSEGVEKKAAVAAKTDAEPALKPKRGRKAKQETAPTANEAELAVNGSKREETDMEESKESIKGKDPKGRKASAAHRSPPSHIEPEPIVEPAGGEDELDTEDLEIEAELERISQEELAREEAEEAEEDALTAGSGRANEYESSPSIQRKMDDLQQEMQDDENTAAIASTPRHVRAEASTPQSRRSDKENIPVSETVETSYKEVPSPSPARALTRVSLGARTPVQRSPAKRMLQSPSKTIRRLHTTSAWDPVAVEIVMATPERSEFSRSLTDRLVTAATEPSHALTSPERNLTVEEWVRVQALKKEEELRRRCEELVARFEQEGNRAVKCLHGIEVV